MKDFFSAIAVVVIFAYLVVLGVFAFRAEYREHIKKQNAKIELHNEMVRGEIENYNIELDWYSGGETMLRKSDTGIVVYIKKWDGGVSPWSLHYIQFCNPDTLCVIPNSALGTLEKYYRHKIELERELK